MRYLQFITLILLLPATAAASTTSESHPGEYVPPEQCGSDDDCPTGQHCIEGVCATPAQFHNDLATPVPDDRGADKACGADRRCRIERLKARNRMRRHYLAAEDERLVRDEAAELFEQQEKEHVRERIPWSTAIQHHPYGTGISGSYTFAGHFRTKASIVYDSQRIHYSPEAEGMADISDRHQAFFTTAHATYLPSRAWFTPLISIGFGMGNGELGYGQAPDVRYHYVTAAIGAEAQFNNGFVMRMAYRNGRLLYNQVRHGPGNYDTATRDTMREFMHDEGLGGFDFSMGWAF